MPSGSVLPTQPRPPSRSQRSGLDLLVAASLLLCVSGCGRVKQQGKATVDSNSGMRQSAIDNARRSCIQTATAKAPHLPGMDVRINSYCDCFATKGLSNFSNSELAGIALHTGHLTQEQQTKLMRGVEMCQGELRGSRR